MLLVSAATMFGSSTFSLTGGTDLVAFNGKDFVLTLGESCPSAICQYGGSQTVGAGTLTSLFTTPDNESITYDGVGDFRAPSPAGDFMANDGVDSITGSFIFTSWNYDGVEDTNGDDGIDLNGIITVTGTTLEGGGDPNQSAFEALFDLPGPTSYSFTLDVGNCVDGTKATACIPVPDPSASFISLDLTPQSSVPEPSALGIASIGLAAALAAYRRRKA